MKKAVLCSVFSVFVIQNACADEPSPAFNGFYIGGGITYANAKIKATGGQTAGNNILNTSSRGIGFNGFFGYGTFFGGGFFLAGELGLGFDGSRFSNKQAGTAMVNGVSTPVQFRGNSVATYGVAARLGYIISNVLPYLKVGLGGHSAVKLITSNRTQVSLGGRPVNLRRNGLVLGGGVDYALTQQVFVRAEYTHNFGARSHYSLNGARVDFKTPTDTVLIGAGYRY